MEALQLLICEKSAYINSMKKHISTSENLKNENITHEQSAGDIYNTKQEHFIKSFQKELLVLTKLNLQLQKRS